MLVKIEAFNLRGKKVDDFSYHSGHTRLDLIAKEVLERYPNNVCHILGLRNKAIGRTKFESGFVERGSIMTWPFSIRGTIEAFAAMETNA